MLDSLLCELNRQVSENNLENEVEILVDDDDKRFLGTKRKIMLSQAKGLFTCAIDDDDWISSNYVSAIVNAIKSDVSVDCIGINGVITTNGQDERKWFISCHYEDWFEEDGIYYRTPNHICPIKTELAREVNFEEVPWGEDYPFSQKMKSLLHKETQISEPIYYYNYSTINSLHDYQKQNEDEHT